MLTSDNHAMLDLETLSTSPHALVLSVGLCIFNREQVVAGYKFDLDPANQSRRKIDFSTVQWWMGQMKEAQAASFSAERNLMSHWTMEGEITRIIAEFEVKKWWANSPSFDGVILQQLLGKDLCGHRDWLDVRTFSWMTGTKMPPVNGVAHDPLVDATRQAQYLIDTCQNWYSN